jgi:tRNA(fMet)-specific endonuclease VapC
MSFWNGTATTPVHRLQGVQDLFQDVAVLDVTGAVAQRFGELRAGLLDIGRPTPEIDLWIAATALVHDLTLVTHNTRDFAQIPSLRLEAWLTP